MKPKLTLILFFAISLNTALAQDRAAAQRDINVLASDSFKGRGYIDGGDQIAAKYIADRFDKLGLKQLHGSYFQKFNLQVNTINKTELTIDDKEMEAGRDYFVSPGSPSASISGEVFLVSEVILSSKKAVKKVKKAVRKGYVPVFLPFDKENEQAKANMEEIKKCLKVDVFVHVVESYVWSVGRAEDETAMLYMIDSSFNEFSKSLMLTIENELIPAYETQNVMGYVEGTKYKDSFIIVCGHYDHLGKMGSATFNGANDNASGISMILDLASYFSKNPQECNILFIAFGAEEAGLVGSYYFVKNPEVGVRLDQIKFVFNLDLMGSGEDGATIVNATVFEKYFETLAAINDENQYLVKLKKRGKAANSDHYFFSEAGVPSFFIYLMGEYVHYHIPADRPENLELSEAYDASFKLIRDFVIAINDVN
ncbi:M28 family peptidase [bacterium]|nr:M28 family peptidase [bacterium]